MKNSFEELLTAQRVRSVWGRSVTPDNAAESLNRMIAQIEALGQPAAASGVAEPAVDANEASRDAAQPMGVPSAVMGSAHPEFPELTDLAEIPIEPPHHLLKQLEAALSLDLGSRRAMVRNLIEPLRVRIHRIDPTAGDAEYHPLRHSAGGTIEELMNRLEDALSGLRRVKGH